MHQGHRGANHPVKRTDDGRVEITAMNHGFAVDAASLPANAEPTHVSLFDGSLAGLRLTDRPAVQRPVPSRGEPRPAGQPLSVRTVRGRSEGEDLVNQAELAEHWAEDDALLEHLAGDGDRHELARDVDVGFRRRSRQAREACRRAGGAGLGSRRGL
jgi:hypothetical protein